jgi:hypothetical protein
MDVASTSVIQSENIVGESENVAIINFSRGRWMRSMDKPSTPRKPRLANDNVEDGNSSSGSITSDEDFTITTKRSYKSITASR